MPKATLTRKELLSVLSELSDELTSRSIETNIYIVGGAAMVMAFDSRNSTRDIDCRYSPKAIIDQIAVMVGERHDLPAEWLNSHAAMFISPVVDDPFPIPIMAKGTVRITAASAEIMLAMKIRASRPRLDEEDIAFLCSKLGITKEEEAITIFENYYPEDPLPKYAKPLLRKALTSIRLDTAEDSGEADFGI